MPRSNARGRADGILRTVGDGTVVAADIGTGVITDAKIATGAITNAKLVPSARAGAQGRVNLTFDSAQELDLSQGTFFDADSTGGVNTTLSFANVPTTAKWNYKVKHRSVNTTTYNADISNWTYTSGQEIKLETLTGQSGLNWIGATWGDRGYKVYALENQTTSGVIHQFDMTTPYDLTTASYNSKVFTRTQSGYARGMRFKPDGTRVILANYTNAVLNTYDLSTAWDISTASYNASASKTLSEFSANQVYNTEFSADGTKFFTNNIATNPATIVSYTLSTAWDPSTATYDGTIFRPTSINLGYTFAFSSTGEKLYRWNGVAVLGSITQYNLSTPYDLSTADSTKVDSLNLVTINADHTNGIYNFDISDSGNYAITNDYAATDGNEAIYRYDLVSSSTVLSTLTLPASVKNTLSSIPDSDNPQQIIEFITSDSGTNVYITNDFVSPASTPAGPDYTISVTNSGLAYILTGTDRNGNVSGIHPTLAFNNGDKVQFNVDAGTSSSHPFYIKTAQVTGTGSQAPGAVGGGTTQIDWTIGSTGTFYYQCAIHSVMNNTITVS